VPGPAANGLERAERSAVVGLLGQAGLLAPPAGSETVAGAERTPAASGQWAFADRLFHARTRLTASPGSYGATYPQQGRRPPLPAVKLVTGATIALPVPDEAGVAGRDMALDVALRTRRTVRDYDETRPVTVQELAELLYRCQRILRVTPDAGNGELARRPYPTAGSLQELEVYPVVHRCAGLDAGIYRYDGLGHRLEVVGPAGGTADRLLAGAAGASGRQCAPQVLLVVTARWGRVMWKYESMAYALILKDLGILFQTLYLVATAMGLAPCALGGGESGVLEAAAGLDPHEEGVVGEFMLGGRPAPVRPLSDKPVRNASLFERE
jgi:SagB-type dehydrogenase family enzyme